MKNLPAGWNYERLKDVALINASSLPASTDADYEFDYLEISNVDYHGIVDKEAIERLRYEDAPSRARRKAFKNNTLISSVRPNLQAVCFIDLEVSNLICSTGFNVVSPNQAKLFPRFSYYVLISEKARQYFESIATGVGYPAVGDKDFNTFAVPIPSLPEQERIAAYLDKSCAAIDTAVKAKRDQIEALEELQKTAIHKAFAELDNYPAERVKDLTTKIGSGVTPDGGAANYLDSGIPLLRSQNVHFDGLYLDDVAYISEETHASMSNSRLQPKDVLLNITGASIGRCTFVPESFGEGNVNQHVCIVRPTPKINYRYLAAFLSSPFGQDQILSSFTGASRQGLSQKELGLIRLPLPPKDVQLQVVSKIEKSNEMYKDVRDCLEKQIDVLLEYRKSLIHECVTGLRRVTD